MKIINIRRIAFGIFVGGLLLVSPLFQAQAMTISPVRLEISGDPGATVGGFFKVINDEAEEKTLYTVFQNFEAMGETGSPSFVTASDGLATWITAPEKITVAPGETKIVDFSVTVPADAEPGGYFSAIFLGTNPPAENPNQLSIGARIGTLLLFRVSGDVEEGASLLEFATKDSKKWFSALPINYYYRFQNTGADRVMPKGELVIKNTFGMETKVQNANPVQGNVLPKSIRRFELWWQKNSDEASAEPQPENLGFVSSVKYQWNNFAFGRYVAHLDLKYGTTDEVVKSSFAVFVFPWQLLVTELLALLILIFILRFAIKRYNSYVIKRSRF